MRARSVPRYWLPQRTRRSAPGCSPEPAPAVAGPGFSSCAPVFLGRRSERGSPAHVLAPGTALLTTPPAGPTAPRLARLQEAWPVATSVVTALSRALPLTRLQRRSGPAQPAVLRSTPVPRARHAPPRHLALVNVELERARAQPAQPLLFRAAAKRASANPWARPASRTNLGLRPASAQTTTATGAQTRTAGRTPRQPALTRQTTRSISPRATSTTRCRSFHCCRTPAHRCSLASPGTAAARARGSRTGGCSAWMRWPRRPRTSSWCNSEPAT